MSVIEMTLEEQVRYVRKWDERLLYTKHILCILLCYPKRGEMISGDDLCKVFGEACKNPGIPQKSGGWCKGFPHHYLRRLIVGCENEFLIEADDLLPQDLSRFKLWYKGAHFRIIPAWYEAVHNYYARMESGKLLCRWKARE
jgi:hypothetical protein